MVGPSAAHVSTKESCVDPSWNDPDTGDSKKCRLYVEENHPCPVALGRLYEGLTTIHNIPLGNDQVKVGVEEVRDADAHILVPTQEVHLVELALNTFVAWPTHLVKRFSEQEDLSEIAHYGQCLSIFVIQLWIFAHWQMVVILPKENVVIWFCSLHNKPDNYMKGIINRSVIFFNTFTLALVRNINILIVQYASMFVLNNALKGFDDTPQSKSKAGARWIVVKYFNDARPLEP
ncbi:hypothetical protein GmHk_08G023278 [Glycine max]|nr:hypothetical protein GmHk_08G023278 [Glycine max]